MKRYLLIFLFLISGFYTGFAQDTSLVKYESYFKGPLSEWCNCYNQFDLSKFRFTVSYNFEAVKLANEINLDSFVDKADTFHRFKDSYDFETVNYWDEQPRNSFGDNIDSFYILYKPLLVYSPDRNSFIDIYSYWLDLNKKDNKIFANAKHGQAVVLADYQNRTTLRILRCDYESGIEEVVWVSNTSFLLCCYNQNLSDISPFVILGDIERKIFWFYDTPDTNCYRVNDYTKIKFEKLGIGWE